MAVRLFQEPIFIQCPENIQGSFQLCLFSIVSSIANLLDARDYYKMGQLWSLGEVPTLDIETCALLLLLILPLTPAGLCVPALTGEEKWLRRTRRLKEGSGQCRKNKP